MGRPVAVVGAGYAGMAAAVTLAAPQPLNGLPLNIPVGWQLQSTTPEGLKTAQSGTTLVIEQLPARARLIFRR